MDIAVGDAFGWVFWGITPRLGALVEPVPGHPLRWEDLTSAVGTLATLAVCLGARRSSPRALIRWALFCFAGCLAWSIGWSPQYELYLVPLVLLAFEAPLVGAAAALLLELLTFMEYPLLLTWAYYYGGSAVWLAWAALVGRYLVLGWLCLCVVRAEASLSAFISRVRVPLRVALAGALVILSGCAPVAPSASPPPPQPAAATPSPPVPAANPQVPLSLAVAAAASPTPAGARIAAAGVCPGARAAVDPSAPGAPSAPIPGFAVGGGWFFPTDSPAGGFSVVDDEQGRFWSELQRLGGWPVLGYPVSRRFRWHGQLAQATQRAVLQWSPLTGQVEFANVLDLLHDADLDDELQRTYQIPPVAEVDEVGLAYETIAARRLAWLGDRPAIEQAYCAAPGGDAVALWGLPTSKAVDMSGNGSVFVLRTQRAAFQEWVNGAAWAAPGQVTVVLAGELARQLGTVPSEALVPEPAPPD